MPGRSQPRRRRRSTRRSPISRSRRDKPAADLFDAATDCRDDRHPVRQDADGNGQSHRARRCSLRASWRDEPGCDRHRARPAASPGAVAARWRFAAPMRGRRDARGCASRDADAGADTSATSAADDLRPQGRAMAGRRHRGARAPETRVRRGAWYRSSAAPPGTLAALGEHGPAVAGRLAPPLAGIVRTGNGSALAYPSR